MLGGKQIIDLRLLAEISAYEAFVQPFVDVLDVAKVGMKRVLNPLATMVALLNPFGDEEWVKKRMGGYKSRRDALAREWDDVNKKITDDLSPDARVLAFLAYPAGYLGVATTGKLLKTGKELALDATGLGPFIADTLGQPYKSLESWADTAANPYTGPQSARAGSGGSLGALAKLFFKESAARPGGLLREQEEVGNTLDDATSEELRQQIDLELAVLGANTALQQRFEDYADELEGLVSELEERLASKKRLIELFARIESTDDLKKYLQAAVESEIIDSTTSNEILQNLLDAAQKLAADEAFSERARELGKSPEEIADETVLNTVIEELRPQTEKYTEEIDRFINALLDNIPTDQQLNRIPENNNIQRLKGIRDRLKKIASS